MAIKQDNPPEGYVFHSAPRAVLDFAADHDVKEIVTDWHWSNRHANPVVQLAVPVRYVARASVLAAYYKRIGVRP